MGIVIGTNEQDQVVLDDGTERVFVKLSGSKGIQKSLTPRVGDIVMVFGKTCEIETQRYIAAELVKKVQDPKWLKVHKMECESDEVIHGEAKKAYNVHEKIEQVNGYNGILEIIKSADKGEGVPVEEIIKKSPAEKGGEIVEMLIRNGEIFEIEPGRVKVLE